MDGGNWKEMFNAACDGDLDLVRWHVAHGVDVDYAHPEFLSTALVACTLAGREEVALYLLEAGASPHLHSEFDGMTPLQAARHAGLARLQARLQSLGARAAAAAPQAAEPRGLWARLRAALRWSTRGPSGPAPLAIPPACALNGPADRPR